MLNIGEKVRVISRMLNTHLAGKDVVEGKAKIERHNLDGSYGVQFEDEPWGPIRHRWNVERDTGKSKFPAMPRTGR